MIAILFLALTGEPARLGGWPRPLYGCLSRANGLAARGGSRGGSHGVHGGAAIIRAPPARVATANTTLALLAASAPLILEPMLPPPPPTPTPTPHCTAAASGALAQGVSDLSTCKEAATALGLAASLNGNTVVSEDNGRC